MVKIVLSTIAIVGLGLIIRVHPDHIILSLIAWASFVYACVLLVEKRFEHGQTMMAASLAYNSLFHWFLLT